GAVWFVRRAGPARRARIPAPRRRGQARASRAPRSALERDGVEPPQEIPSLELQLVDVAVLVRDREVETRVLAGAVHPARVDGGDAVCGSPPSERHRGDRAAVEVGADGDGFIEGFATHVRGAIHAPPGPYCTNVQSRKGTPAMALAARPRVVDSS